MPDSLLLTAAGTAMTPKRLSSLFADAFAAAGLVGTLHWLRRTFAMTMLVRLQVQVPTDPDISP